MANKVGRPKREFTEQQLARIDEMCLNNCKDYTVAEVIGVDVGVLKDNLAKRLKQKRAEGRAILSRQQKEKCAKGDTTMLIWRGKNDLDQTDRQELTGKGGSPLVPLRIVVKPERIKDDSNSNAGS